jgi:hypothetical protein
MDLGRRFQAEMRRALYIGDLIRDLEGNRCCWLDVGSDYNLETRSKVLGVSSLSLPHDCLAIEDQASNRLTEVRNRTDDTNMNEI